jgi:hypothetical protein
MQIVRRITSAHVLAVVALFVALGGGAYAALKLPKNSVKSATIKNGQVKAADLANKAVTSKKIKDRQVKTADLANNSVNGAKIVDGQVGPTDLADGSVGTLKIADGAVNGAKIADGQVGGADLTPDEPFHLVGAANEPAFGNGGEGDCLWQNVNEPSLSPPNPFSPVSFYKGKDGVVHLAGVAEAKDGPGGDAACGGTDNTATEATVFVLPAGYRPPHLMILAGAGGTTGAFAINGDAPIVSGTTVIPPGVVLFGNGSVTDGTLLSIDGSTYRAAGPGTGIARAKKGAAHVSPEVLRALGVRLGS